MVDHLLSLAEWMEKESTPFPLRPSMLARWRVGCFMAKECCTFQMEVNMRPPGKTAKLNRWRDVCVLACMSDYMHLYAWLRVFHIGYSWYYIWSLLAITHRYCRSYWVSLLIPCVKPQSILLWCNLSWALTTTAITTIIIIISVAVHLKW